MLKVLVRTQAETHAHTWQNVLKFLFILRRKHMHTHGRMWLSSWLDSGGTTCTHGRMCSSSSLDSGGNTCTHSEECVKVPGLTPVETQQTHGRMCSSSWLDSGGNTCTHGRMCSKVPPWTQEGTHAHTRKNVLKFLVRL